MEVPTIKISVDTREQQPLRFPVVKDVEVVVETVPVGDYSAFHGLLRDPVVFERKSCADLYTSYTTDYDRERAKFAKAKDLGLTLILAIEGTATEVLAGHTYWKAGEVQESRKSGLAMIRQCMTVSRKYGVDIWFCAGRREMAWRIQEYFLAQERLHVPA